MIFRIEKTPKQIKTKISQGSPETNRLHGNVKSCAQMFLQNYRRSAPNQESHPDTLQ